MFYGTKPNLCNLPEFGSKVWVHTTSGSKLNGKLVIGQWVGFDEDSSGHWIYSPDTHTVSVQHSVKFNSREVELYLPHIILVEEDKRSTMSQPGKLSEEVLIKSTDPIDPLGESFEHLPEVESCPKHV